MLFRSSAVFLLTVASLAAAQTSQQPSASRRPITDKDLFDFIWVANPQISPDGSHVAFTRVNVDEKHTGYETSLWMISTDAPYSPVRLTNGKHDGRPRWSPDGKRILFVRAGEKDESGKPKPGQIAVLSLSGGEARTVTDLPKGAGDPEWSPDGKQIAFTSSTTDADIQKAKRKPAPGAAPPEGERESDVHVITRAIYRSDDAGYLDFRRHSHIWILQLPPASDEMPKPVQLTNGNYDEDDILWSPDGSRIYFTTRRIDEPYYEPPTTDIFSISPAGGTPEQLASIPMGIYHLTLSADGSKLAFHGSVTQPARSYSEPDLWVMDTKPNANRAT